MANALASLTTEGMERQADTLGGGKILLPTDIYKLHVKYAYLGESSGGALSITVVGSVNGSDYSETFWITNKEKKQYYMSKNGKKVPLPGFAIIEDMCLFATGKSLSQQNTVDKIIEKYDPETSSMQKASVPVVEGLLDKDVLVAISQVKEFKRKKFDDGYHTISETTEYNEIDKVFHLDKHLTANEVLKNVEEPAFYTQWLEAKKGKVRDKTKGKSPERPDANTGSGMPSADPTPVSNPFA